MCVLLAHMGGEGCGQKARSPPGLLLGSGEGQVEPWGQQPHVAGDFH